MHGRVKVKTSAEKERERRIEKEEKCKLFKAGLEKAFEMRQTDNNENALTVTAPLLMGNPDVYTLWNYRREVIAQRKKTSQEIVEKTDNEQSNDSENFEAQFEELCNKELDLTSSCLLKNPKSYCVWHHRAWILQTMKYPNWKREVQLCNGMLEVDERNFHCWDFRRFVRSFADISVEEELEFSLKKVEENFSNFSSWHYRSSLFTEAHINGLIDFSKFWNTEYSMIENALFTDPNDQSPWFYHKWLLATNYGKNMSLSIEDEKMKVCVERSFYESKSGILAIVFNKSLKKCPFRVTISKDNDNYTFDENSWCPTQKPFSRVWYLFTSIHHNCDSVVFLCTNKDLKCDDQIKLSASSKNENIPLSQKCNASEVPLNENQKQSLKCLLEMEPSNKWVNMAVTLIGGADPQEIAKLDVLRRNYYSDQHSKAVMRSILATIGTTTAECVIQNMGLTCFYFGEQFVHLKYLDLSGNKIRTINSAFNQLIFLEKLILNNNQICDICSSFELLSLAVISLQNNNMNTNCLESLTKCRNLRQVYVFGNDCHEITESSFDLIFEEKSIEFFVKEHCNSDIISFVK